MRAELISGNGGAAASRERASGENEEEAERVQASGEAAGRRSFQVGQHVAWLGQVEHVVATRRQPPSHGRP